MTTLPMVRKARFLVGFGILSTFCLLSGCPSSEATKPSQPSAVTTYKPEASDKATSNKTDSDKTVSKTEEAAKPSQTPLAAQVTSQTEAKSNESAKNSPEKSLPAPEKKKSDLPGLDESLAAPATQPRPDISFAEGKLDEAAPDKTPSNKKPAEEESAEEQQKPHDLGQPLVDKPEALVRLDPRQPVWVDRENKHVVLLGEVCRADYPLEFFATYSNRSYEAVMSINVTPSIVHAGLLAVGATPGRPVQFQPEFVPPSGTEIAIEVRWKGEDGKIKSSPAQHWIRNITTKKELDCNWVFAGSMFVTDDRTGKPYYLADSGELICALNLPTAMLDLPIRSYAALESRLFEPFKERLPPEGTPATVLLKPILSKKDNPSAQKTESANPTSPDTETKPSEKNVLREGA
jgi:hypothetical protein